MSKILNYSSQIRLNYDDRVDIGAFAQFEKEMNRKCWKKGTYSKMMLANMHTPDLTGFQRKLASDVPSILNYVGRRGVKLQQKWIAKKTKTQSPNGIFNNVHYVVPPMPNRENIKKRNIGVVEVGLSKDGGNDFFYVKYLLGRKPGNSPVNITSGKSEAKASGGERIYPTTRRALYYYDQADGKYYLRSSVSTGNNVDRNYLDPFEKEWFAYSQKYLSRKLRDKAFKAWQYMM